MKDCPLSKRGMHNWKKLEEPDSSEAVAWVCDECGQLASTIEMDKHIAQKMIGASNADYDGKIDPRKIYYDMGVLDGILEKANTIMSPREEILDEARQAVMHDRNLDYGDPEDNFRDIAALANIMFAGKTEFDSVDAAIMGLIIKMSRLKTSPTKKDHWVDIAGYAACGWDCVVRNVQRGNGVYATQGHFDFERVPEGTEDNTEMREG